MKKWYLLLAAFTVSCCTAVFAEDAKGLRLPAVIGDNMVFQSGVKAPVWGWAEPGDKVTVELSPYDLDRGRITYRYK